MSVGNDILCAPLQCNICLQLKVKSVKYQEQEIFLKPIAVLLSNESTNISLLHPRDVYRCSGCQVVFYCSVEHQQIDWPQHRDFCHAMKKIISTYQVRHPLLINDMPDSAMKMERRIFQVKFMLRQVLQRPLRYNEEELSSFPAYCAVCFKLFELRSCRRCQAVSYCSEEHARLDLSHNCHSFQLYYCPFKGIPSGITVKFHRRVPDLSIMDLVTAFEYATLKRLPAIPIESNNSYQQFATAAGFSYIFTICYALGFVEMRRFTHRKFVIFIVGATDEQHLWFRSFHTQFFFLQYPDIKRLELYFIGPDAVVNENAKTIEHYHFQGLERTILYVTYSLPFEEFIKEFKIPCSLIVIYNCGFWERRSIGDVGASKTQTLVNESWVKGIRELLLNFDVPIVFTSCTQQEADFDYGALIGTAQNYPEHTIRVERIFNVKKNPYRDLRPQRNLVPIDKEKIFYHNGYVQAVRTRLAH